MTMDTHIKSSPVCYGMTVSSMQSMGESILKGSFDKKEQREKSPLIALLSAPNHIA